MYFWKYPRDSFGVYLSTFTNCTKFFYCFTRLLGCLGCYYSNALSYRHTYIKTMDFRTSLLSNIRYIRCAPLYIIDLKSLCDCSKIPSLSLSRVIVHMSMFSLIDIGQSVIRFNTLVNELFDVYSP